MTSSIQNHFPDLKIRGLSATIASLVSWLSVKGFQACFASGIEAIMPTTGGEVIAVDGKTARGSRDRRRGWTAIGWYSVRRPRRRNPTKAVEHRVFLNAIPADALWKTGFTGDLRWCFVRTPVVSAEATLRRS